ncbi:hypothetical protein NsoK4_03770 [Nitrosopumilus sp. K4]|uniref:hypothetical protein n=1 Tax=Nitrosopumilus sp. K4 TaxID=2795383 RepID=UPI001BAA2849|nr:hypothetical protein [Nitrosopumilus sp. K4]QUC65372.1 hypothetical protein NsoK4_03770 [Nitrosopumilus sp. K4]
MNRKILLGATITATFAVLMFASPLASAITSLTGGNLDVTGTAIDSVTFDVSPGTIDTLGNDFGGYGVLTDGTLVVVTSHKGVYDSEGQTHPNKHVTFDVCNQGLVTAGFCGPEWHTHMVDLAPETTGTCNPNVGVGYPALEVANLSWEEATSQLTIDAQSITVEGVPSSQSLISSISGTSETWNTGNIAGALVDFDLRGAIDGDGNLHVCVENIAAVVP